MKALRIVSGDPPQLAIADLPEPKPGPGEVLVRISASGVNRADLLQRRGLYPPPDAPADVPGLEFAGAVAALGSGVTAVALHQRVFGLCSGGAHAQYIVSSQDLLMPVPEHVSEVEAGAIPEAYVTAHDALVTQAGMRRGERVLVHAIGSGVGIAALQIARMWGCEVFGTARSPNKRERAEAFGAAVCPPESFDEEMLKRTDGKGVDVILDPVGASYFERDVRALATLGRLVIIATMAGTTATLALPILMRKRLRIIGTMLRSRSLEQKVAATRAFERDLLPKFASGELKVVIDQIYPLEQASAAYDYVEENRNFGKVVLTMSGP